MRTNWWCWVVCAEVRSTFSVLEPMSNGSSACTDKDQILHADLCLERKTSGHHVNTDCAPHTDRWIEPKSKFMRTTCWIRRERQNQNSCERVDGSKNIEIRAPETMYPTERCKIKTHAHELTGKIRIHVYELVDQESGKTRAYEQKDQVENNPNSCLRGDGSQHESTR